MLMEARGIPVSEPFSISNPKNILNKVKDKLEDGGAKIADVTKDVAGKTGNIGKDIANTTAGVGKKLGSTLVNVGKGVGKIFTTVFKKILQFLTMLLRFWKIIIGVIVGVFILYVVNKGTGFFKMFTG